MTDAQIGDEWYRYDAPSVFRNDYSVKATPWLSTFRVVKLTPKGVWLDEFGHRRWVSCTARRRYAYPTKELALESYRIRCRWRLRYAEHELKFAQWLNNELPQTPDDILEETLF